MKPLSIKLSNFVCSPLRAILFCGVLIAPSFLTHASTNTQASDSLDADILKQAALCHQMSTTASDYLPESCESLIDHQALDLAVNLISSESPEHLLALSSDHSHPTPNQPNHNVQPLTLAAQISHDAKQYYLGLMAKADQERQAYNAGGLTSYNPHEVAYVELSSKYGLSASARGIKVIADNKLNLPPRNQDVESQESQKKWWAVVTVAAVLTAVVIHSRSQNGSSTTTHGCQDGFVYGVDIDSGKSTCISHKEAAALGKTKCKYVRAVFPHPIIINPGHPAYNKTRDGDNNGLACEPWPQ